MRADRLLAILLIMQNRERVTAAELAAHLEVSERTIYRDMDALSMAGVPVVSERGSMGGWNLLDGYRANLNALNVKELQTLFLSQPLFVDLGLEQSAKNALLKLLTSLPGEYHGHVELVNRRLYIDPTGWQRSKENVSWLPTLQEAVWNDRTLTLHYRLGDKSEVERIVEPLGLVAKGNVWYFVGITEGDVRTYRVSRIVSAAVTEQAWERPQNFDLKAYWQQSMADYMENITRYPITIGVSPAILPRIRYAGTFAKIDQVFPPDADGWSKILLHFDMPDEAREFVLGFGTFVEVVEPITLKDEVVRMAEAVIRSYQSV
jgi:predicted DNA-binding transcriptional regulator YafY